jgi:hypothetical protein
VDNPFLDRFLDDLCTPPTGADRAEVIVEKQIARYQAVFQRPHLRRGWDLWCNVTTYSQDRHLVCDVARFLAFFIRTHPELDAPDRDWAYLLYRATNSLPGKEIAFADLQVKLEEFARDESQPE